MLNCFKLNKKSVNFISASSLYSFAVPNYILKKKKFSIEFFQIYKFRNFNIFKYSVNLNLKEYLEIFDPQLHF